MPASASAVSTSPSSQWLTPERVAHAEFRSGFRGLDPAEVRAFLARVASELRTLLEHEAELVSQLEEADERNTAVVPAPLDIRQVSELLGQETARVLETAREAAADIKARAESDAGATIEAAEAEAERLRTQAEGVLAERTTEADAAANAIRDEATADAERIVAAAEERAAAVEKTAGDEAEQLVAQAKEAKASADADGAASRDAAREEGKRMVAEARAVRERILTDMARRRNVARQQLERVRAARERLLEAIDGVRLSVTEAHGELSGSLVEAKLAGDRSARAVDIEDIPPMRELDAEVELAKDTGLIDLTALAAAAEDLSPVDTGEFAAVTAPEPAVDRGDELDAAPRGAAAHAAVDGDGSGARDAAVGGAGEAAEHAPVGSTSSVQTRRAEAADEPTVAVPVVVIDDDEPLDAKSIVARVAAATAAAAPVTKDAPVEDAPPAKDAPAEEAPPAKDVTPATPDDDAPKRGRRGTVEVVRRESTPVSAAKESTARPSDGVPDAAVTDPAADAGGATGAAGSAVAGKAEGDDGVVIDLRDGPVAPAGGDASRPDVSSAGSSAGEAGVDRDTSGRRSSRRGKGPSKADELFARLRDAGEQPNGNGHSPEANGRGAAAVIGLAVAERPEGELAHVAGDVERSADLEGGEADGDEADDDDVDGDDADGDDAGAPAMVGDVDRVALHTRDAVLGGNIRDLSRQLKLALSDQQNELLEASRTVKSRDLDGPAVTPLPDMTGVYVRAAEQDLALAWTLGRRSVAPQDSAEADTARVADQAASLAAAVVDALRQRLDADQAGEPWSVDRVRAAYREVRSQRLAELVEFHVFDAYAQGQLAAAPAGHKSRWVCDSCGPDCLDNALASPVAFGDEYPTGHQAPPAFAGCRCVLVVAD